MTKRNCLSWVPKKELNCRLPIDIKGVIPLPKTGCECCLDLIFVNKCRYRCFGPLFTHCYDKTDCSFSPKDKPNYLDCNKDVVTKMATKFDQKILIFDVNRVFTLLDPSSCVVLHVCYRESVKQTSCKPCELHKMEKYRVIKNLKPILFRYHNDFYEHLRRILDDCVKLKAMTQFKKNRVIFCFQNSTHLFLIIYCCHVADHKVVFTDYKIKKYRFCEHVADIVFDEKSDQLLFLVCGEGASIYRLKWSSVFCDFMFNIEEPHCRISKKTPTKIAKLDDSKYIVLFKNYKNHCFSYDIISL